MLARVGRRAEFEEIVAEIESRAANGTATWTEVALAYMGAEDHAAALTYLERAPDQRPPGNNLTAWIGTIPLLDPVRDHPRFQNVLKRLNLA